MRKSDYKARRRRSLVNMAGGLMLVVAVGLAVFLFFENTPELYGWYLEYQNWMDTLHDYVMNLPNMWLILLAVLVLYAARSWLPVPISMLVVITSAIMLPMYLVLAVNIAGLMILFSVRYFWGRKRGGGQVKKLISRQQDIRDYLEHGRGSKAWLLFVFRLLPNFALNSTSQMYGAMKFDYTDFLLISVVGYLPKLITYTVLGRNVSQPLAPQFIVPLIIAFALLGISTISVNLVLHKHHQNHPKPEGTP